MDFHFQFALLKTIERGGRIALVLYAFAYGDRPSSGEKEKRKTNATTTKK